MLVAVLLGAWVLASLLLTLAWVEYRRFLGTHSLEEFDPAPQEPSPQDWVHR